MKSSFYLVVPEQRKDPQMAATFAEPVLRQWIAELPSANPGLATRLFQDLINDLVSLEMTAANRLAALELLRPQFLMIEDYLRSRLVRSGFPKGEIEKKIFSLTIGLEKQFTIGYWSVARELTRREVGWLQGKNTALAIQRVIKGLSHIVISHYMMGYQVPSWIWYDLHSLYKLGVKSGKEKTKVADQAGVYNKSGTVEDAYKQILLLSLAYPSGLMQKEFLLVYGFIEKVADWVTVEAGPADQPIQCLISMDEDLPPAFAQAGEVNDKRKATAKMYLNLSKLHKLSKQPDKYCSKDEARFSSLEIGKGENAKLSAELFDYLMQRWSGVEPHGTASFADRLNRYLALGLDATHELQDSTRGASPGLEVLAETYSEQALYCGFETEGVLSIGSLVSFRKTDTLPHQRTLGVVCKIQLPKQDDKLIFEISVIAPQSYSVHYFEQGAEADAEPRRALLYGVKTAQGERSYIILESFMIKDGDVLKMSMGKENFPIILNGRRNIGLGYWQFECRRLLDNPSQQQPAPGGKKGYDFV